MSESSAKWAGQSTATFWRCSYGPSRSWTQKKSQAAECGAAPPSRAAAAAAASARSQPQLYPSVRPLSWRRLWKRWLHGLQQGRW